MTLITHSKKIAPGNIPDKGTILNLIADARAKGDMKEVKRLQAFLPVNRRLFEECLAPLFGKEETAQLLDEVEESKRRQREQFSTPV